MATQTRSQRARFAQEASERRIAALENELKALCEQKYSNDHTELDSVIQKLAVELKRERQALKRKIQNAENQKKFRDSKKMKLNQLCTENPEIKRKLALRDAVGRPSLHHDQPELMKAITDIAMNGSTAKGSYAQSKRTLEELTRELHRLGFNISRSATYLRLLPKNPSTTEGARHVNTIPVKLRPAQEPRRPHPDGQFAATSIQYLETLASCLGPLQTFFISQFVKARVPLGHGATDEQAPLLMHMDCSNVAFDHDWMEAEKHKLIPSIYGGIIIEQGKIGHLEAITSSGPTYVTIRSGQQGLPTTNMHFKDLERIIHSEEFRSLARTEGGKIKPVMIIIVDGGPDESPRYEQVINAAVNLFKEYDIDGMFIATHAPDKKYNRVERRMALLSREVEGLLIPHDHFLGSLLDAQTSVNDDTEKVKFGTAGRMLAEVWSSMTVDGYPVRAHYRTEDEPQSVSHVSDGVWYANHVRESQYLLQITKCNNFTCCSPPRSGLFQILRDRFVPPPVKMVQTEKGIELSEKGSFPDLLVRLSMNVDPPEQIKTYDHACPSVKNLLQSRTCTNCGLYHASIKSLGRHTNRVHPDVTIAREPLVKPWQIGPRRGDEILCYLYNDDGYIDVEWRDLSEMDHSSSE